MVRSEQPPKSNGKPCHNGFRAVSGHIRAYEGADGAMYLFSNGDLITKLPSGAIFKTKVPPADRSLFEHRMQLVYIGDVYADFDADNYDRLIELVRGIRGSDPHSF